MVYITKYYYMLLDTWMTSNLKRKRRTHSTSEGHKPTPQDMLLSSEIFRRLWRDSPRQSEHTESRLVPPEKMLHPIALPLNDIVCKTYPINRIKYGDVQAVSVDFKINLTKLLMLKLALVIKGNPLYDRGT